MNFICTTDNMDYSFYLIWSSGHWQHRYYYRFISYEEIQGQRQAWNDSGHEFGSSESGATHEDAACPSGWSSVH